LLVGDGITLPLTETTAASRLGGYAGPAAAKCNRLVNFHSLWQSKDMKKQASDQQFHDRRYQERKRAEEARKPLPKKAESAKTSNDSTAEKDDPQEKA